ncbi:hypothetical protein ABL78_7324 [Leptomonas seymouri]|uniref:Uncharacterized protein n=1 Tax=Leptomonas seymouri TaxID=5684 RepID=A0A0N1PBH3_LEPSE|nr:hypothetical protein ABL78_7324 [Leptomonas seymouri]|eukprot:KPI83635.1 hypothetical protein ABL78_7324 [Leptomonas seymouri]
MAECTVYSPCGRYVVHFASNAQQQRLWLDVTTNPRRPNLLHGAPLPYQPSAGDGSVKGNNALDVAWGPNRAAAPSSSTATASPSPLHLAASLSEGDVVALTASAGVRKSFANFSKMLFDALIGRSACVNFYVETVAEMKERIQRDVQQQRRESSPLPSTSSPATQQQLSREKSGSSGGGASTIPVHVDTADEIAAAIDQVTMSSNIKDQRGTVDDARARVCAAVGDTVIELDADIADEVLEQRFLTVDYDVDFTRAIFPIPLSEVPAGAKTEEGHDFMQAAKAPAASAPTAARKPAISDNEKCLERELHSALEHLARLEGENTKLRKENAALVQLSKQKMQEMQRLCGDFQQRVEDAAHTERLRAKNAELRMQLQEAIEERQAALCTLERERSQRRLLGPPLSTTTRNTDPYRQPSSLRGGGGSASRRSSSNKRDNPYLRSLSQGSNCASSERGGSVRQPYSNRRGPLGSSDSRRDRHGQPLLSPTPTPTVRRQRRPPTRFDTPPGPSAHGQARSLRRSPSYGGGGSRADSHRQARASSAHSVGSVGSNSIGGGDSPAPRDRTGGRQAGVVKPRRSRNHSDTNSADRRLHSRDSSSFMPRRGPSMWADTSDHPSPRGSVASSRCSSASHERLYRTTTVSSRQHQTPKAYALEELGVRRAVFH